MDKLAIYNRQGAIDVLAERLEFERTGVELYDRILEAMDLSNDPQIEAMRDEMEEYRDEEKEHEEWLEDQIRALGGDPDARTRRVQLVEAESVGIERVILASHATIPEMLHALLAAELVDNASWALLGNLAAEAGDDEAQKGFMTRLEEEARHLLFVTKAVEAFTVQEVLGEPASLPSIA